MVAARKVVPVLKVASRVQALYMRRFAQPAAPSNLGPNDSTLDARIHLVHEAYLGAWRDLVDWSLAYLDGNISDHMCEIHAILRYLAVDFLIHRYAGMKEARLAQEFSAILTREGVGLGIGITNLGMNPEWLPPETDIDPSLPVAFSETKLDANFGVYFKGNGFYAGLSTTHIPAPDFNDSIPISACQ